MNKMNINKLIFYIVVIIFILILLNVEYRDVNCVDFNKSQCGPGLGSIYISGKIDADDTSNEILDKINISAKYQYNTIAWRQSLVIAFITSFVSLIILNREIPNPTNFLILSLTIYLALYFHNEYLKNKIGYYAIAQIEEATNALR